MISYTYIISKVGEKSNTADQNIKSGERYDPDYVTNHFKVILKRNKLRDIRFHELRHSCASLLLAKGIPMKMIQDWLGHSDMATTANIYSHIDSTSKKETAQAIGELLG